MAGRPDGDVWNIVDNDKDSQHYGRDFRLNFSYISSEESNGVQGVQTRLKRKDRFESK